MNDEIRQQLNVLYFTGVHENIITFGDLLEIDMPDLPIGDQHAS